MMVLFLIVMIGFASTKIIDKNVPKPVYDLQKYDNVTVKFNQSINTTFIYTNTSTIPIKNTVIIDLQQLSQQIFLANITKNIGQTQLIQLRCQFHPKMLEMKLQKHSKKNVQEQTYEIYRKDVKGFIIAAMKIQNQYLVFINKSNVIQKLTLNKYQIIRNQQSGKHQLTLSNEYNISYELMLDHRPIKHFTYDTINKVFYFYSEFYLYSLKIDSESSINKQLNKLFKAKNDIKPQSLKIINQYIFFINGNNHIEIHHINNNTFREIINQYQNKSVQIIDMIIEIQQDNIILWSLDYQFGIYLYKIVNNTISQEELYQIPYGKKLAFIKHGNTFEIMLQIYKKSYILQLYYAEKQIYINRFYKQIKQPVDMYTIDSNFMIVIGKKATLITRYGINAEIFFQYGQYKHIGNLYESVNRFFMGIGSDFIITTKNDTIFIYELILNKAKIECDLFSSNEKKLKNNETILMQQSLNFSLIRNNQDNITIDNNLTSYKQIERTQQFQFFLTTVEQIDSTTLNTVYRNLIKICVSILLTMFIILACVTFLRNRKKQALKKLHDSLDKQMKNINLGANKKSVIYG